MNHYYHPDPNQGVLSPEESAHAIKVLRKREGDELLLIDGLGNRFAAAITKADHRKCGFEIKSKESYPQKDYSLHIAIAPTKNIDRLEWFVEKACEMGIDQISLLQTKRTERNKVNLDRLEKKAVSALKQSKGYWKCQIHPLTSITKFLEQPLTEAQKFVAFVDSENPALLSKSVVSKKDVLILIGPEGDFTPEERDQAKSKGFEKVSLGQSVLRTETAGIVACSTVHFINSL